MPYLRLWLVLTAYSLVANQVHAQQTKDELKAKLAASVCASLQKSLSERSLSASLTREQYNTLLQQSFAPAVGKEVTEIQRLYGKDAFSNEALMRTIGAEVGAHLLQSCPTFVTLSSMIAKGPASTASTSGQSVGKLGELRGVGFAVLELQISEIEKAEFTLLSRFQGAEELLPKLPNYKGRRARISWQEIEIYHPDTKKYNKHREITGIELL